MISIAAIITAATAIVAGILAVLVPAVGAALALAFTNLVAFLIVLPVKWTIEAIHRQHTK